MYANVGGVQFPDISLRHNYFEFHPNAPKNCV